MAQAAATSALLTGGRFRLGVGTGEAAQLLPLPRHFGQLSQLVPEDAISSPCGPDPQAHVRAVREYAGAGFDEVYVGQVGPDQDGFFGFYAREVLPRLRGG